MILYYKFPSGMGLRTYDEAVHEHHSCGYNQRLGRGLMDRRKVNICRSSYLDMDERLIKDASDTCRRLMPYTYHGNSEREV